MLIKKNDELIDLLLKQFSDYGKNIELIKQKYNEMFNEFQCKLKNKQCEEEEIDNFFHKYFSERQIAITKEEENNKPILLELQKILSNFTQEMLVAIYEKCSNNLLKSEIFKQIEKNNNYIDAFNNLHMETGAIFEIIESMTAEERERLISLRESNQKININNSELQSISEQVNEYLLKVMNGYDLHEEKQLYWFQHGIKNEVEFQFRKKGLQNQKLLDAAKDAQEMVNDILNLDDHLLIDTAYNQMSGIQINIPGKKI